jgi:ribonuclease P/MRP protein subunit POP5
MVRIKNRYLLVNILYPPSASSSSSSPTIAGPAQQNALDSNTALYLKISRPTPDYLTAGLLARMVRDAVGEMYGDWGIGRLGGAGASGLSGMQDPFFRLQRTVLILYRVGCLICLQ